MIYLDSSALMKLVRREAESEALEAWLSDRRDQALVTSELGRIEVFRAASRIGDRASAIAREVVSGVDLVVLDRQVQDLACTVGKPLLRTLDALHLASALVLGDELSTFVAYDDRLRRAAQDAGLPTEAPSG